MNKNKDFLEASLDAIDKQIRAGQGGQAQLELDKLYQKKIPREFAPNFAALCWRANIPQLGLRLLFPTIRPEKGILTEATPDETVEYAACLVKVGAGEEALKLLEGIDPVLYPRALLVTAFSLVSQWEYKKSIPLFQQYVAAKSIPHYQRLVGLVNLAAADIYERDYVSAQGSIDELVRETRKDNLIFLLGNSLELGAVSLILQKRYDEAFKLIEEAKMLLKDSGSLIEFFVRKWESILLFLKHAKSKKAINLLHKVRDEAEKRKHWETLRDLDRYEAIARKDEKLLVHLYFGTPYGSFRERILQDFENPLSFPDVYAWAPGKNQTLEGKEIDLLLPTSIAGEKVKQGQLLSRLLFALSRDFYRPIRVASLHHLLYPDEFFNPVSSPARIHVAVGRIRDWLKENNYPLIIEEDSGAYRLMSTEACRLLIPRELAPMKRLDAKLLALKTQWPNAPFSAKEAAEILKTSPRTALRLLTSAMEQKTVEKTVTKTQVLYKFVA